MDELDQSEMIGIGPLDLTDADETAFDALPSGDYLARVHSHSWARLPGGEGKKLPEGTPRLSVRFTLSQPVGHDAQGMRVEGRTVFNNYHIVPEDSQYAKENKNAVAMMKGALVNLLMAVGHDKDSVKTKKFDLQAAVENLGDQEVKITLGPPSPGYTSNTVKAVKPATDAVGSGLI